jgi:hypothetical protein
MIEQAQNKIAELKNIPSEENLQSLLRESTVEVDFTKLDGDKRIMKCTKSLRLIPEALQPKSNKDPQKGTVTVWDIDAKGWRSFKYERVNSVTVVKQ